MKDKNNESDWYWEVMVRCDRSSLDLISCQFFENGATGVEEITDSSGNLDLKVYFESNQPDPVVLIENLSLIISENGSLLELLSTEKKEMENWQSNWQKHFKPLEIGNTFVITPPWEKKTGNRRQIVIQPGFGFGTGYHESTHLALELLEWFAENNAIQSVLDVGTGSGILSIAASLSGASSLTAIDIDKNSVDEVAVNFELSGLDISICECRVCSPEQLTSNPFDLVMANIEDHILKTMVSDLLRLTKLKGNLLLSGILTERRDGLLDSFGAQVSVVKEVQMNEWTGLILRKL